jgi:hypothetical protein
MRSTSPPQAVAILTQANFHQVSRAAGPKATSLYELLVFGMRQRCSSIHAMPWGLPSGSGRDVAYSRAPSIRCRHVLRRRSEPARLTGQKRQIVIDSFTRSASMTSDGKSVPEPLQASV